MPDELLLSLLFLLIGLFAGGLGGWLAAKLRFQRDTFSQEDINAQYVHRSLYQQLEQQSDAQREDLFELQEAYRLASEKAARLEQANLQLEDTLRRRFDFEDITKATTPPDFERRPLHECWWIRHK